MNKVNNQTRFLYHKKYRDTEFVVFLENNKEQEILDFYYQIDFNLINNFFVLEQKMKNLNNKSQIYNINCIQDIYDAEGNIKKIYLDFLFSKNTNNFIFNLLEQNIKNKIQKNYKNLNKILENLIQKSNKLVIKKTYINKNYWIKILMITLTIVFGITAIILFILFFVL